MTRTYNQLAEFSGAANQYIQRNKQETKLVYALGRVIKRVQKIFEEFNESLEALRIDNCATGEKGVILRDERGAYQFTKEGLKQFNSARRALSEQTTEIEPYMATNVPEDLSAEDKEAFAGYVLPE